MAFNLLVMTRIVIMLFQLTNSLHRYDISFMTVSQAGLPTKMRR